LNIYTNNYEGLFLLSLSNDCWIFQSIECLFQIHIVCILVIFGLFSRVFVDGTFVNFRGLIAHALIILYKSDNMAWVSSTCLSILNSISAFLTKNSFLFDKKFWYAQSCSQYKCLHPSWKYFKKLMHKMKLKEFVKYQQD